MFIALGDPGWGSDPWAVVQRSGDGVIRDKAGPQGALGASWLLCGFFRQCLARCTAGPPLAWGAAGPSLSASRGAFSELHTGSVLSEPRRRARGTGSGCQVWVMQPPPLFRHLTADQVAPAGQLPASCWFSRSHLRGPFWGQCQRTGCTAGLSGALASLPLSPCLLGMTGPELALTYPFCSVVSQPLLSAALGARAASPSGEHARSGSVVGSCQERWAVFSTTRAPKCHSLVPGKGLLSPPHPAHAVWAVELGPAPSGCALGECHFTKSHSTVPL